MEGSKVFLVYSTSLTGVKHIEYAQEALAVIEKIEKPILRLKPKIWRDKNKIGEGLAVYWVLRDGEQQIGWVPGVVSEKCLLEFVKNNPNTVTDVQLENIRRSSFEESSLGAEISIWIESDSSSINELSSTIKRLINNREVSYPSGPRVPIQDIMKDETANVDVDSEDIIEEDVQVFKDKKQISRKKLYVYGECNKDQVNKKVYEKLSIVRIKYIGYEKIKNIKDISNRGYNVVCYSPHNARNIGRYNSFSEYIVAEKSGIKVVDSNGNLTRGSGDPLEKAFDRISEIENKK